MKVHRGAQKDPGQDLCGKVKWRRMTEAWVGRLHRKGCWWPSIVSILKAKMHRLKWPQGLCFWHILFPCPISGFSTLQLVNVFPSLLWKKNARIPHLTSVSSWTSSLVPVKHLAGVGCTGHPFPSPVVPSTPCKRARIPTTLPMLLCSGHR